MCGERRDGESIPNESDLIRQAQAGDRAAYDRLVRLHQRSVYRWAYNIVRTHDVADEVTQEVFVRTFLALDRIDPERPLGSWLCKTAVNVALNIVRKQKFRSQFVESLGPEGAAELAPSTDQPDTTLRRKRVMERLQAAIDSLPPLYRTVLLLRTRDHLSYEEIAEHLGVSLGTVMSRLNRARSKLRSLMGDSLEDLY
jgi:RNA polymerase sigma-70 factor (ECF subfamily)